MRARAKRATGKVLSTMPHWESLRYRGFLRRRRSRSGI
jgi:hypothetical protein